MSPLGLEETLLPVNPSYPAQCTLFLALQTSHPGTQPWCADFNKSLVGRKEKGGEPGEEHRA